MNIKVYHDKRFIIGGGVGLILATSVLYYIKYKN